MKEIEFKDDNVKSKKVVINYAVVVRFIDGVIVEGRFLYESYEQAKDVIESMSAFHMNSGDLVNAERYSKAQYMVYPVEVSIPNVKWEGEAQ